MQTNLVEVMSSIQGEGLLVGCRQVFVRFLGCNLACPYCDTPASLTDVRECRVERTAGKRDFYTVDNPLTPEGVTEILGNYDLAKIHSISFTGGEPLLQADFLEKLIPMLSGRGPKIYLETNGTLPGKLKQIIELLNIISMDIKLTGDTPWQAHAEFLAIASQKQVYVKAVVLPTTSDSEILATCRLISGLDNRIPLILQPVTPYGSIRRAPTPARMLEVQDLALEYLQEVRVIPQTHKIMGQL
jgi:7-carboxy-7-deazaguanine synthase